MTLRSTRLALLAAAVLLLAGCGTATGTSPAEEHSGIPGPALELGTTSFQG